MDKNIKIDQIGEKIMDTSVQFSIREILVVSGEVADYLHDQIRKYRISIEDRAIVISVPGIIIHMTTIVSSIFSILSLSQ